MRSFWGASRCQALFFVFARPDRREVSVRATSARANCVWCPRNSLCRRNSIQPSGKPPALLCMSFRPESFQVDEAKIAEDARYDGKWVLRTNTERDAADVALQYKRLWLVEQWFRSTKSLIHTRPIYHRLDATIRGHVFCSFLALVLRQELQARKRPVNRIFKTASGRGMMFGAPSCRTRARRT
jgi:hypothetical protein